MNYCLDCGTSETGCGLGGKDDGVNYRLNYGTFRNLGTGSSRESPGELLLDLPYLRNQNSRFVLMQYGELLPGLPYLRNYSRIKGEDVIGELLLDLWHIRNLRLTAPICFAGELLPGLPYLRNRAVVLCPLN